MEWKFRFWIQFISDLLIKIKGYPGFIAIYNTMLLIEENGSNETDIWFNVEKWILKLTVKSELRFSLWQNKTCVYVLVENYVNMHDFLKGFRVQNNKTLGSDLILSVGTRLWATVTGRLSQRTAKALKLFTVWSMKRWQNTRVFLHVSSLVTFDKEEV
jgi:hypothetical protein